MTTSFPPGGLAVVIGASGGIGAALVEALHKDEAFGHVVALSRSGSPALDVTDENSILAALDEITQIGLPVRLVIDATGFLHGAGFTPEKSFKQLDPAHMAYSFAVNAIGPALLMKYFLPLLPQQGKAVFATLSAKVGSIGDNHLGGWYSYRASKAALNQIVRTFAIELKRQRPQALCVALHPGTVETKLSALFAKSGLAVQTPSQAAKHLLETIDRLSVDHSGGFFNAMGEALPW